MTHLIYTDFTNDPIFIYIYSQKQQMTYAKTNKTEETLKVQMKNNVLIFEHDSIK